MATGNKMWMTENPSFEDEVHLLRVVLENERKSYATSQTIMYCEVSNLGKKLRRLKYQIHFYVLRKEKN